MTSLDSTSVYSGLLRHLASKAERVRWTANMSFAASIDLKMLHFFLHKSFFGTEIRNYAFACVLLGSLAPAVLGEQPAPDSDSQVWSESQRKAYASYALTHPGSAEAGKELFFRNEGMACAKCHQISGEERAGPNLTSIADKYWPADVIRHTLYPNEVIQSGYETVVIVMNDGKVVTGTLKGVAEEELRISNAEGRSLTIQRDQIEQQLVQKISLMPANLMASVSQQQFTDLVAYLNTLQVVGHAYQSREEKVKVPPLARYVKFRPFHGPESKFDSPIWFCPLLGFEKQYVVVEHKTGKVWRMERTSSGAQRRMGRVRF